MFERKETLIDLESLAITNLGRIYRNLNTPMLYEEIVRNREGHIAHLGPVVVRTGHLAVVSPDDKFVVRDPNMKDKVLLGGRIKEISQENFDALFKRLTSYMQNKDIYIQDCFLGADPDYQIPIRIATETAWHSLFVRNMFRQILDEKTLEKFKPAFTVIHIPNFQSIPEIDGTKSSAFVIVNIMQKIILIGGTSYAGELKQTVSLIANFLAPHKSVFFLQCAANIGKNSDVALFLGRTGNGKTILATDPDRKLVGDHEHGWSDKGIFNYGWGCYAKIVGITPEKEPIIYDCTRTFGTILENVSMEFAPRRVDLSSTSLTENIRAAYPITHIRNSLREGICGHPKNIFLITRDTEGVLPPLARLTHEQAVFAFLISYNSSLSETQMRPRDVKAVIDEEGDKSSQGMQPHEYAIQFMKKLQKHNVKCWFLNTGWVGEPQDRGDRIGIEVTRALIKAVLSGALDSAEYEEDAIFHFEIPKECPGVSNEILNPREAAKDIGDYEIRANKLAMNFVKAFEHFAEFMPQSIRDMVSNVVVNEETIDVMDNIGFAM